MLSPESHFESPLFSTDFFNTKTYQCDCQKKVLRAKIVLEKKDGQRWIFIRIIFNIYGKQPHLKEFLSELLLTKNMKKTPPCGRHKYVHRIDCVNDLIFTWEKSWQLPKWLLDSIRRIRVDNYPIRSKDTGKPPYWVFTRAYLTWLSFLFF